MNTTPSTAAITSFVKAGSVPLDSYTFVSKELNEKKSIASMTQFIDGGGSANVPSQTAGDQEKSVEFRMNETGNIFYAVTSPDVTQETKDLFASVVVLFAAMSKAMFDKKKDLFDYAAWSQVIGKSGYFVEVEKLEKKLHIEGSSVSLDTQIVTQLLPGLTESTSMEIAKGVLQAIGGQYTSSTTDSSTKIGHLLFICEELFGAPSVTVRLFFLDRTTHTWITSSPCHSSTRMTIDELQEANTFLFVSPQEIAKYAPTLNDSPVMDALVAKLSEYIDGPTPSPAPAPK